MARIKKSRKETEKDKKREDKKESYFYSVGRRKTSIAQVRIYTNNKSSEDDLLVNGKKLKNYFAMPYLQNVFILPFRSCGMMGKFKATVLVRGGGVKGQAEACQLGIARALVKFDGGLKKMLKDLGLLTRDSRIVERKKPGLKKARKAPQWAKR